MSPTPGHQVDGLGAAQLGLVTIWQLCGLGLSRRQVDRWVAEGRLVPVRRGVYRLAGIHVTWEVRLMAAVLASRGRLVASSHSAVRLWGLDDARGTGGIHLSGGRVRMRGARVHYREVPPAERTTRLLIPVTTVPRTLTDLAGTVDVARFGRLTDEALRLRVIGLEQLRRHVDGLSVGVSGRRPLGAGRLEEVLADRLPGYDPGDSAWERTMDNRWEAWGLPPAVRQYEIVTPGGTYRPDRAIVAERIAVDWNGYEYHGSRSRFDADSDRRADLATVGWWLLDFTSRSSPERICAAVHSLWTQRRRDLAG